MDHQDLIACAEDRQVLDWKGWKKLSHEDRWTIISLRVASEERLEVECHDGYIKFSKSKRWEDAETLSYSTSRRLRNAHEIAKLIEQDIAHQTDQAVTKSAMFSVAVALAAVLVSVKYAGIALMPSALIALAVGLLMTQLIRGVPEEMLRNVRDMLNRANHSIRQAERDEERYRDIQREIMEQPPPPPVPVLNPVARISFPWRGDPD